MMRPPRGTRLTDESMYALNFYSPMVADQLRQHRKTATIRLGDKSGKYRKGMIVQVLCGARYSPRERIFDAVVDKVEVKTLGELSPREIEHDNPEIRRTLSLGARRSLLRLVAATTPRVARRWRVRPAHPPWAARARRR